MWITLALGLLTLLCGVLLAVGHGAQSALPLVILLLGIAVSGSGVAGLFCVPLLGKRIDADRDVAMRTDAMTGILNRLGFYFKGCELLTANPKTRYMSIDLDVDRFTNLNILYGYDHGDELLCAIGSTLQEACEADECCGRIEGDRFTLLLKRSTKENDRARIDALVSRVRTIVKHPLRICVGVYEIENNKEAIEYATDCAAAARLSIKRDSSSSVAFYDYTLHQQDFTSNELVSRMEEALHDHEFCAYYQPIFDIRNGSRVCAAEALVRWIDRDGRFMPPDEFIHLFERNGFIMQLDYYVLEEVCRMQNDIIKLGLEPVPIAVNFSRAHLYEDDLIAKISALLNKYCIAHWMIDIELTESMLNSDQERMLKTVSALSAAGFSVSMDDFGSGASSLSMLKTIQLDKVKLDRAFLAQCDTDARGRTVVRSVLRMTQQLKLLTIAEGVETQEQLDFLHEAGCDMAQGYLLARPMPADRFRDMIDDMQTKRLRVKTPRAPRPVRNSAPTDEE